MKNKVDDTAKEAVAEDKKRAFKEGVTDNTVKITDSTNNDNTEKKNRPAILPKESKE